MKTITKMTLAAASLLGLASSTAVYAQDAPAVTVSAALAVQSDYRFRGISQNNKKIAPQGTLNFTLPEGFYVGTWASQTNWQLGGSKNHNPGYEVDIYGGKHTTVFDSDLNIEAYYYAYPDANTFGGSEASFVEIITQLSHSYEGFSLTGTWAYSPMFSLGGGVSNYLAGNLTIPVNDWLSLSGNLGHQWVQAAKLFKSNDYTHFDAGATASYMGFALDARYVGTDLTNKACGNFYMATKNACSGGGVVTLTYNIAFN